MGLGGSQRYRIPVPKVRPVRAPRRWARVLKGRPVVVGCWAYAAALLAISAASRLSPATCWPVHLLFYGPRWAIFLPMAILVPLAVRMRLRRESLALASSAIVFLPIWGWTFPRPGTGGEGGHSPWTLRVLTSNVQGRDLKVLELISLIRSERPDVVLLQEFAGGNIDDLLGRSRPYVRVQGEFLLASRFPIESFEALRVPPQGPRVVAVRARLRWGGTTIPVVDVHLMTPREGLEAILNAPVGGLDTFRRITAQQSLESQSLRRWVEDPTGKVVMAGDFNLTEAHPMYRRDWSHLENAFGRAGWGLGHTMFTRSIGLRIDHVLSSPPWRTTRISVGPEIGSAHRPVIVHLEWDRSWNPNANRNPLSHARDRPDPSRKESDGHHPMRMVVDRFDDP